jgi:hypothetical protein
MLNTRTRVRRKEREEGGGRKKKEEEERRGKRTEEKGDLLNMDRKSAGVSQI